jgi:hypothetical protein
MRMVAKLYLDALRTRYMYDCMLQKLHLMSFIPPLALCFGNLQADSHPDCQGCTAGGLMACY